MDGTGHNWQVRDRFLEMRSRWVTLIGEHFETDRNETVEYWRVERVDSVIVLPIHADRLWLAARSYRPGIAAATLDFPGGRLSEGTRPEAAVPTILQRELGIDAAAIAHLTPLNAIGWSVDSSFSSQKLYGFVAHLHASVSGLDDRGGTSYPTTEAGVQDLLQTLTCLQCRSLLLEWWLKRDQIAAALNP